MPEYKCTYGASNTPDTVFVHEGWYVVDNSTNVNFTRDEFYDGIDVETIRDEDSFSWSAPIRSEEELIAAVEA